MINVDLSTKTVLITGDLGAIVERIVRQLTMAGATLVLTDVHSESDALQMLKSWNLDHPHFVYYQMDVTDGSAVERVVQEVMERFHNLDIVLGHAGEALTSSSR